MTWRSSLPLQFSTTVAAFAVDEAALPSMLTWQPPAVADAGKALLDHQHVRGACWAPRCRSACRAPGECWEAPGYVGLRPHGQPASPHLPVAPSAPQERMVVLAPAAADDATGSPTSSAARGSDAKLHVSVLRRTAACCLLPALSSSSCAALLPEGVPVLNLQRAPCTCRSVQATAVAAVAQLTLHTACDPLLIPTNIPRLGPPSPSPAAIPFCRTSSAACCLQRPRSTLPRRCSLSSGCPLARPHRCAPAGWCLRPA